MPVPNKISQFLKCSLQAVLTVLSLARYLLTSPLHQLTVAGSLFVYFLHVNILPVKFKRIDYSPEMLLLQSGLLIGAAFYSLFVEIWSIFSSLCPCFGHV